jgi:farnesyl diphosphate synthase
MDIVTYKTAYYSFFLPVVCGLHVAGAATDSAVSTAKAILLKMGQYFQIQDDYLDCFADVEVLGKIGTDIQDNKCSWLVCLALQEATSEQRAIIAESYGQDDAESIARIKNVYRHAFHASCSSAVSCFVFARLGWLMCLNMCGRASGLQSLHVL